MEQEIQINNKNEQQFLQQDDKKKELINSVPEYDLDLDCDPKQRWIHILKDYKEALSQVEKKIDELGIPKVAQTIIGWFKSKVFYVKELQGIADYIGWDISKIIMMQLVYEASAHCTSIIAQDKETLNPIHIRTMEWEMPFLRPITIQINLIKNKQIIAKASTWVGYVGILTGLHAGPNPFSISVNFRIVGESFLQNLKKAVTSAWPIGFLVREILTSEDIDYEKADQFLCNSELIAPVYFILCGNKKQQGKLITRNRSQNENPLQLDQNNKFLIQTNMDHWSTNQDEDIMDSLERFKFAKKSLLKMEVSKSSLWAMMSKNPIMSEIVVYGTFMNPQQKELETRLTVGQKRNTFIVKKEEQIIQDKEKFKCNICLKYIIPELNVKGECKHIGQWHSSFEDCNYFKCAIGLGPSQIGKQHWSCCYSVLYDSSCQKSDFHY